MAVACSHTSETVPAPPSHSTASFVLEKSAAQPGSRVNLGIKFVIESGWHIYWQNPGDSGEPPRIQWRLPAGMTAGTLAWPTPLRLTTTAGTDYGYEGTTVLLSSLQIPPTAQPGATLEVSGNLRWLVCHDICVPQRAQLSTPLRIAGASSVDESASSLLQSAAERMPRPLPARFRPLVTSSADSFRLTLATGEPVTKAEFFPAEAEQIDDQAQQALRTNPGVLHLTLKKAENLGQDPRRLKGVIVLNGRDAYELDAPIRSMARQKRR